MHAHASFFSMRRKVAVRVISFGRGLVHWRFIVSALMLIGAGFFGGFLALESMRIAPEVEIVRVGSTYFEFDREAMAFLVTLWTWPIMGALVVAALPLDGGSWKIFLRYQRVEYFITLIIFYTFGFRLACWS